jgi:hypothetical protein
MENPLIHSVYEGSDGSGEIAELLILGDTVIASTYPDEGHLLALNPNDSWQVTQTIQALEQSLTSAMGRQILCRRIRLDCVDLDNCNEEMDMSYVDEDIFNNYILLQDLTNFKLEQEKVIEEVQDVEFIDDDDEDIDSSTSKIFIEELMPIAYNDTYSSDPIAECETSELASELLYRKDAVSCIITDEDFAQVLSSNGYIPSDENILILKTAVREMTSPDYYKNLANFASTKHSVRFLLEKQ